MNRNEVVELMKSSVSEDEWNANSRKVKEAFGGGYPDFWYHAIIQSGIASQMVAKFGTTAEIKVVATNLRPLDIHGRPRSMPFLNKDEKIVGMYDRGLGEKTVHCTSLKEMQQLYDSYAEGMILGLSWYVMCESYISL